MGDMNGQLDNPEIHSAAAAQPKTKISIWKTEPVVGSTIHGVENELLVLQKMLGKPHGGSGNRNGFKAIGIIGVRGIGKSTVCRALLQDPEVKSNFLPRIWVSMSRKFTEDVDLKIALVKRILICLGVGVDTDSNFPGDQTLRRLLYALRLQLRGKRYLIVLDDVQEFVTEQKQNGFWDLNSSDETGEKLIDGFPKAGGAVIVTSRSEKAAKAMVGEGNLRRLVPQKDPESLWEIFWQAVTKNGDSRQLPANLKEMKVDLMKKCDGLPLAAKMMGQIKFNENS